MDSISSSVSSKAIVIKLQAVNLLPIGRLTEEYKPLLVLCNNVLEIHWEVQGKDLMARIHRSSLSYLFEVITHPMRILLKVKSTTNQFSRFFINDDLITADNVGLSAIVAIAKPFDAEKALWSDWAEGLEDFSMTRREWIELNTSPLADETLALGDNLAILTTGQLRKSDYISTSPRPPSSSAIIPRKFSNESTADDDQKVTEHLGSGLLPRGPAAAAVVIDTASDVDPTLGQDAAMVLSAWQLITTRMQRKISINAQTGKDQEEKKALLKKQQDDLAVREAALKQQLEHLESEKKILKDQQDRMAAGREALKRQQKALLDREACLVEEEEVLGKATMELQLLAKRRRTC